MLVVVGVHNGAHQDAFGDGGETVIVIIGGTGVVGAVVVGRLFWLLVVSDSHAIDSVTPLPGVPEQGS